MKKLFTILALLTCFMGAKAEWVQDYKIDYSTLNDFPFYVMGYAPAIIDGVMVDNPVPYRKLWRGNEDDFPGEEECSGQVTVNGTTFYEQSLETNPWRQYIIANEVPMELDGAYTIKVEVRSSEAISMNLQFGNWGKLLETQVSIPAGDNFQEIEWKVSGCLYAGNGFICVQPATSEAVIEWKSLTVSHDQKEQRPTEWIENIENGDAEKSWEEMGFADVRFDDMENNYKICAWGKERERNMNDDGGWDPFPCDIVQEEDGNHAFIVHGQAATTEGDASAWDNQFWIQSPKEWKSGEQLKIKFRYKASKAVTVATQIHHQKPSDYLIWHAIGDISFTEDWQTFDGTMTMEDDMAGGWSIAFQLNQNDKDAIDFYFDDLSWQNMKLDEGYFVAGCNTKTGLEYDYANAVQFEYDESAELYTATIGEDGWVSQVMISTVRGNDAAFKGATLKPDLSIGPIINDPDDWHDYAPSSLAKITLPGQGVWKIYLDDNYKAMAFEMLDGELIELPEINPNPTVIEITTVERDDLADSVDGEGNVTQVNEEEGGTGQPWDNQFWIVANRKLSTGEVTIVEFDYVADADARTTTQLHDNPGAYRHWAAIGDVNFTTEEQHFSYTLTIPSEANDMLSIAFNLSEIKESNKYIIKNVVWKLEDGTESLIDQTGSKNFYVKVIGEDPHVYGEPVKGDVGGDGVVDVADISAVISHMAGTTDYGTAADVNGDGEVDVADISAIITIMAGVTE
jgi:hypothetical protein